jgi:hypothetical protein
MMQEQRETENMTVQEVADLLHASGLHAFANYYGMGYSHEEWEAFRRDVAIQMLRRVEITKKDVQVARELMAAQPTEREP